ncbi:MAG: hypothetical protein JWN56_3083 [Sphingobacteriales bacterium]|nr:hypothetical protein [Sphingobacteriales bacterium]
MKKFYCLEFFGKFLVTFKWYLSQYQPENPMKNFKTTMVASAILLISACQKNDVVNEEKSSITTSNLKSNTLLSTPRSLNGLLGKKVSIYSAEYITSGQGNQVGQTVYFSDRGNKQLEADFVPGLSLDGTDNISYYVDNNRPSADLPVSVTESAIDRAMKTWDNVQCSNLGIFKVPYNPAITTGFVSAILGYGGSFDYVADITHAGWLPKGFFDSLAPQGGDFILGVTFTLVFEGDADNNGKQDVAFREIYYNDGFQWNDGAHYDVETIALHESGHGLSQAHFGKAFRSGNGKLHFAPLAVMNAAYSGIQTTIGKTDLAGHCSNWASWPNK